jgi:hypothetical protein
MSRISGKALLAVRLAGRSAALLSLGVILLFGQSGQAHPTPDTLTFFKNYFVTGDYVVGGKSLWLKGVHGVATQTITISGVPPDADILAAFLYVQTAERLQWSGIDHAKFNGHDLGPKENTLAKALTASWADAPAPCWTTPSPGRKLITYRADVLRYLIDNNPFLSDGVTPNANYKKFVANGVHSVQVPDSGHAFGDHDDVEYGYGTGPRAVGASLVVIYRDPNQLQQKAIVIIDGSATKRSYDTLTEKIEGFYQASSPVAKMTHIVGDGRPYASEKVRVDGQLIASNPFVSGSGHNWDNRTFDNVPLLNPGSATVPGFATVKVVPAATDSDCLSYSAIIFSTTVQDADGDGLLDIWETAGGLTDPNGELLPDLAAMGADKDHKDLFVEVGAMAAPAGTSYGSGAALTMDAVGHNHLPRPAVWKMVGDAYKNAPDPIRLHVDAGPDYEATYGTEAHDYIIPPAGARDRIRDLPGPGLSRHGELEDWLSAIQGRTGRRRRVRSQPRRRMPAGEHLSETTIRPGSQGYVPLRVVRPRARQAKGSLFESRRQPGQ